MNKRFKVMLGMSFFKNHAEARKTARAFSDVLGVDNLAVLGLETELSRDENLPESQETMANFLNEGMHENWPRLYLWDKNCDRQVLQDWAENLPMPFYEKFSYGGAVNRLLALAKVAGCEYLIRVDPGTAPPYYFQQLINYHVSKLEQDKAKVVSGQYTDRIALRDNFVPSDKKEAYYQFIRDYTGVDPRHNKQVTGGAAITIAVAGPPAIPFDGARVWASDDGYFQLIFPSKALILPESIVPRTDPGYPMPGTEYFVRLASMVVLCELHKGSEKPRAKDKGSEFFERLMEYLDSERQEVFDIESAKEELRGLIEVIFEGYNNYKHLNENWLAVIEELDKRTSNLDSDCWCRIK